MLVKKVLDNVVGGVGMLVVSSVLVFAVMDAEDIRVKQKKRVFDACMDSVGLLNELNAEKREVREIMLDVKMVLGVCEKSIKKC